MKKLILSFLCVLIAGYGFAGDVSDIPYQIANNVSEECVTCAAYFLIASEAFSRSGYTKDSEKMKELFNTALDGARFLAQEGRTQEMAEKVVMARLELNIREMRDEIDNSLENLSILINKHAYRCKEVVENPEKIMAEWQDKILKGHMTK